MTKRERATWRKANSRWYGTDLQSRAVRHLNRVDQQIRYNARRPGDPGWPQILIWAAKRHNEVVAAQEYRQEGRWYKPPN